MITRFIGVREFRQNVAKLAMRSRNKNERLIVLRNNEPIFEVRPLSKKDATLEALLMSIREAEENAKAGRVYSIEDVEKMLGL